MNGRGPEPLWRPSAAVVEAARLTDYCRFLRATRGLEFPGYAELWEWSVPSSRRSGPRSGSTSSVRASRGYDAVLPDRAMPGARWFPGAVLSYAEHVFAGKRPDAAVALVHASELRPLARDDAGPSSASETAAVAAGLRRPRRRARRPGRRLPPEHRRGGHRVPRVRVASAPIWSSCSPDFGVRAVVDRFAQIEPKVLLAVDGYRYGGRDFDRLDAVERIRAGLPDARAHGRPALPARAGCAPGRPAVAEPPRERRRSFASSSSRSTTRSGCCTRPARRACRRRSCTARAGSCSST